MHIVGRERKDKGILTGIDNGGRFPCQLLRSHKIRDILGNDDLHTVILSDTLCQLVHKIQGNGILAVDKHMGFIDNDNNLPLRLIADVVIPVFDNLIVQPF